MLPTVITAPLIGAFLLTNLFIAQATVTLLDPVGLAKYKKARFTAGKATVNDAVVQQLQRAASTAVTTLPYSVTNTTILAPNGDKHEYYSWAVYFWPSCTGVSPALAADPDHNCPYKPNDGKFVPDGNKLQNPIMSSRMNNDVLTLTLAYDIFNETLYAKQAALMLDTWFLNPDTYMKPEMNFGQVVRGPAKPAGNWTGRSEGIIDIREYTYIPFLIPILETSGQWTPTQTAALKAWFSNFTDWLQTSPQGIKEKAAVNNHGTFWAAQTATYLHFVGKDDDARKVISDYVNGQFQGQIKASGEQPLETARTRPFHYSCFNLNAMVYMAGLSQMLNGTNLWNATTKDGGSIQKAVDYLLPNAVSGNLTSGEISGELLVSLVMVRQVFGDSPDGRYQNGITALLPKSTALGLRYWQLWNPSSLDGIDATLVNNSTGSTNSYGGTVTSGDTAIPIQPGDPSANGTSSGGAGGTSGSSRISHGWLLPLVLVITSFIFGGL